MEKNVIDKIKNISTNPLFFAVHLLLLKELSPILKSFNVKPFLDGGSLLSYLRYKGFMSWDDDLDLGVQFDNDNDYNTFVIKFIEKIVPVFKACVWVKEYSDQPYSYQNKKMIFVNNSNDIKNIKIDDIYFFNVTLASPLYKDLLVKYGYNVDNEEYFDKEKKYIKTPWIDIFPYIGTEMINYSRVFGSIMILGPDSAELGHCQKRDIVHAKKISFFDNVTDIYIPHNPVLFIEREFGRKQIVNNIVIDGKHGVHMKRIMTTVTNPDLYKYEMDYNDQINQLYRKMILDNTSIKRSCL